MAYNAVETVSLTRHQHAAESETKFQLTSPKSQFTVAFSRFAILVQSATKVRRNKHRSRGTTPRLEPRL